MATLADALRELKLSDILPETPVAEMPPEEAPTLRLPRPPTMPPPERRRVYWQLVEWLYRRWDVTDEAFTLEVSDVCSGNMMVWETWLDLAPLDKLRRGLALIESEDAYLGPASPWRQPKYQ